MGALDLYLDSCRLSGLEVAQLPYAEVAVAVGDVEEEVADGVDACFGGGFGRFRADAFQRAQSLLEDARARPVDGRGEQVGAL